MVFKQNVRFSVPTWLRIFLVILLLLSLASKCIKAYPTPMCAIHTHMKRRQYKFSPRPLLCSAQTAARIQNRNKRGGTEKQATYSPLFPPFLCSPPIYFLTRKVFFLLLSVWQVPFSRKKNSALLSAI